MRIQCVAGTSQGEKPERETMQNHKKSIKYAAKMWRMALLFVVLVLFSGCTRKEELLLLDEEPAMEEALPDISEDVIAEGNKGIGTVGESQQTQMPVQEEEEQRFIYVHVCGAVVRPGVYELKAESRVYEAVQEAGGFTEQAEQDYVNQAQKLTDGVKLVIPTIEEAVAAREGEPLTSAREEDGAKIQIGIVDGKLSGGTGDEEPVGSGDGRININTASEAQLCEIPGIGATRAAAIAAYRDAHGGFGKPEDIMKVSGIKEGMYEKIKDSICVN